MSKRKLAAIKGADYQKDINNVKSDLTTKISVLDVKLNILIAIALNPAARTLGLW